MADTIFQLRSLPFFSTHHHNRLCHSGYPHPRSRRVPLRQSHSHFLSLLPIMASSSTSPSLKTTHDDCPNSKIPHVLSVAGSDSGAGAGIQADIKACGAAGVYCSTVLTAVTAQNTVGVQGVHVVPEEFVALQLTSVLSDMNVDVVKTGMLPSIGTIKVLCDKLKEFPVRALVVDPVMMSTSGDLLTAPSTLSGYLEELLPMADMVTPNLKEASAMLGGVKALQTLDDMCSAAKAIHSMGCRYVLVKGGHLKDSLDAVDIFFDGEQFHELHGPWIDSRNTHGTGCTLASCIAAELAKGCSMLQAVQEAKNFVGNAILHSKYMVIGSGQQGPLDHLFHLKSHSSGMVKKRFNSNDLLLYAVTDSVMNKKWGRSIVDAVKSVIEGGATIIQLREKEAETHDFVEAAISCMEICRSHGVMLLINDRIDVALACEAHGVHVGQSDMPVIAVRNLLGPNKVIGVSCKTPEQAHQAWVDGADYIGCGGVFPTTTKENNRTIGLDGLKTVCSKSKLPVVAIGGINASNARSVMEINDPNLKGVAVVSALFNRKSILDETRHLKSLLLYSSPSSI